MKFPKDFLWGAAASAPQTEGSNLSGGKSLNTWDKWFELSPERFDQNVGPQTTSDVYKLYKEDVQRMRDMNLNSYRTSISWTRLLPEGKTLNQEAVTYYRDYFQTMIDKGIHPIINLFHFDMPWWMMEKGGWTNAEVTDHFAFYAQTCIEEFGDLVKDWTTFNEPIVHVECSYLYEFHYPAIVDFKLAILAGYNTILAHAKAIKAMRNVRSDIRIGTILNLTPVYGRSDSEDDVQATRIANALNITSFMDAMVKGTFDPFMVNLLKEHELLPETDAKDLEIIRENTAEFLGVNYYQPRRVQAPSKKLVGLATMPEDFYEAYAWPERRMNPYRGWEIYPEAIKDIANLITTKYDNMPWYVSENGMGVADEARFKDEDGMIQDAYRIEFVEEHLHYLSEAIADGANCFGYHMWTFVDCWSWLNGYRNRYGFYSVDLETQKRTPKASSFWMRDFIQFQQEGE